MSKAEFMTRFQRQLGKRALFPFAFHCTGMPISSAAIRLQREIANGATRSNQPTEAEKKAAPKDTKWPPLTQYEILMQLGIAEAEIPRFTDPNYWLDFFPPLGKQDLQRLGIHTDWRRNFITTAKNPYYDQFVRWQFHHLKQNGKIKFGKRYTIYSESEKQPCADHDRATGEGVGPQEYAGIKIRLLEFPDSLAQFSERNVFLVAGTLRPETMYGQTNCFVLPEGEYGVYEMKNDDLFIITERAARHFAHQEMTKVEFQYPSLAKVMGSELIGKKVKAPMTSYEYVYVLPLPTISMTKGTAVVSSVPSDAPHDYAMLRDLQTKEGLRERMGVQLEWVQGFDPIPLIDIEGMGDLCAKHCVEEMKIQSHKDTAKLDEAKDKCYQAGFDKGIMKIGDYAGKRVEDAKPLVRKQMIDMGVAVPYYEPEKEVKARTGEACIVALCDQWLLDYGEESWKNKVQEHVSSDRFQTYNPKTQKEFDDILEWLKEWGCSRTTGLGTRVPWDEQFVIESLSDSTIYMAYYTIAHLLQGGVLEGSEVGPSGIPAEAMTIEAFDYVFLDRPYNAEKCPGVSEEQLAKLRYEFNYWYPMDLRVSGKDLIRNHLTMSLYNHQAIWQDNERRMTRSYFCNGYLNLNGEKMSKSTGNFMTLGQCIKRYGSDATRICLADSGDTLDDANFDESVGNASIMKLFVLEQWIQHNYPKDALNFAQDDPAQYTLWDKLMMNEINRGLTEAHKAYSEMKHRNVVVLFNQLLSIKESYLIAREGQSNPFVIARYVEAILSIINPITPHFCQYVWQTHVLPTLKQSSGLPRAPADFLCNNGWPEAGAYSAALATQLKYLEGTKREIRLSFDKSKQSGGKKKGKGKAAADAAPEAAKENVVIAVGSTFPEFKQRVLQILQEQEWTEAGDAIVGKEYIAAVRAAITDKKQGGVAMSFAAFVIKEAAEVGKETALMQSMPFEELEVLQSNQAFLFENMGTIKNVRVVTKEDASINDVPNGKQLAENAVPGKPAIIFY